MIRLDQGHVRSIAVLRALMLGDFLVAIPAFRALRAAFPEARIDYVGLPWARDLVTGRYQRYFSGFVEFAGFPGLVERPWEAAEVTRFLQRMQQQEYDVALQLHGRGDASNACVALWGARMTVGLAPSGSVWLRDPGFMAFREGMSEVYQLLRLLEFCGIASQGEQLDFPVNKQDEQELARVPVFSELRLPYVCIHPGAASSRAWPAEAFAAVADDCAQAGYDIAITGTQAEVGIAHAVTKRMKNRAVVLSGRTSLGALAVLLQRAALYVGNDTGAAHLAAAVGAPSVVVFSTSDPGRWAVSDKQMHRIVLPGQARVPEVIRLVREQLQGVSP